jgi:hypothetical protein
MKKGITLKYQYTKKDEIIKFHIDRDATIAQTISSLSRFLLAVGYQPASIKEFIPTYEDILP